MLDYDFYINFYLDLKTRNLNQDELEHHYESYGKQEGRFATEKDFYNNYPTFDLEIYKNNNYDLHIFQGNKYMLLRHYHEFGKQEGRITNPREKFINICLKNLNYMRNIYLPDFCENSYFESVLVEYRCLPHLEFLIRNTIIKLGEKWSHTIICGNLNYDFMLSMCFGISKKIKVIKTNYDNLLPSDYSKFLTSLDFWYLLHGEKILIYQEDSIIFKNNIDDFLHWDYIGAPWPANHNHNKVNIGNGGFSLRSKSIMIKIIETISVDNTKFNSYTLKYIKKTNSTFPPEDVYFTKNMEDLNIGLLADRNSATNFSSESIMNKESFGSHQIWITDETWEERIYKNIIIQFKSNYDIANIDHRGGWKKIINQLINNNFYNDNSEFEFFDMIERPFLWNNEYTCEKKWGGIIHCTPKTPPYLENFNILNMFTNQNFINSLKNCLFIITLSEYISHFLNNKFKEIGINICIYTLKHPVDTENILLFDYNKYVNNDNKKIVQVGQQLRKLSSIYLIDSLHYNKLWLTGMKDFGYCSHLLDNEVTFLNIDKMNFKNSVTMYYTKSFEEYDEILSENIVFIDLFDAAANNAILECIVRNTPIIVNKIDPVVEYLGEYYPLYFNNLSEVPFLLTDEKIFEAHQYLCNMNKEELNIDFFIKKIINISLSKFK
jgi:hypothetical protein